MARRSGGKRTRADRFIDWRDTNITIDNKENDMKAALDAALRAVTRVREETTALTGLLEQYPELVPHVRAAADALLRVLMALDSERDDVAAQ